jgi:hypothetical protein
MVIPVMGWHPCDMIDLAGLVGRVPNILAYTARQSRNQFEGCWHALEFVKAVDAKSKEAKTRRHSEQFLLQIWPICHACSERL